MFLLAQIMETIGEVISWAIAVEQIVVIPAPQIMGKVEMISGAVCATGHVEIASVIPLAPLERM